MQRDDVVSMSLRRYLNVACPLDCILGPCASYEYKCDNGRCISDDVSCGAYKSCGAGDECHLSSGAIAGIVVGGLAAVALIVVVLVMIGCCMRRQRLPTTTVSENNSFILRFLK